MENENVQVENSNTTEEVADLNTETQEAESEETIDQVREKARKAEELANNYKIRAEKAERKAKEVTTTKPQVSQADLSQTDVFTLVKAGVESDDIGEIKDYAKMKGISIAEALKSSVVKSILSEKAEQRQTAQATNVGSSRRTTAKVTDESLLERARKDDLPDSHEDMMRIARARKGIGSK